jgi:hypothetical protein
MVETPSKIRRAGTARAPHSAATAESEVPAQTAGRSWMKPLTPEDGSQRRLRCDVTLLTTSLRCLCGGFRPRLRLERRDAPEGCGFFDERPAESGPLHLLSAGSNWKPAISLVPARLLENRAEILDGNPADVSPAEDAPRRFLCEPVAELEPLGDLAIGEARRLAAHKVQRAR